MSVLGIKRVLYPLIIPIVIVTLCALIVWAWPLITDKVTQFEPLGALLEILPLFPYAVFSVGIIMGWRYANAGMALTSLALGLSYFALHTFPASHFQGGASLAKAVSFLLPLNLALFPMFRKRRVLTFAGVSFVILIVSQVFVVALASYPLDSKGSWLAHEIGDLSPAAVERVDQLLALFSARASSRFDLPFTGISVPSLIAFLFAITFLLVRYLYRRDVMHAGFLGSSVAAFLAVAAKNPDPSFMVYFFAAGMTLIVTSVESSFSLAYTDELTGLPGRRSLNQALINLGKEYAIGMVDVDHFKKFNDRYGHKTGDQVLKMVASKLQAVSGGGKSFRYGGEEFAVIFPGKTSQEAVVHLDGYRKAIAATPFVVRGKGRRARSAKHRGKSKASGQKTAKLTVSIGVAAPGKRLTSPEQVLKAADKKLYKAKKAGRNRVVG